MVGGELFLNLLQRCELVCNSGSGLVCLQRWRSSVWVWLAPFRSAGKNTRQCLWNETHLGDTTTCLCLTLQENVAHTYRNMDTHLSGCLIIKEESPRGACSTLVHRSPVGSYYRYHTVQLSPLSTMTHSPQLQE